MKLWIVPAKNKIIIESSHHSHTFADVDFIVYCQKALYSKSPYRVRIVDWEPEYCIAYIKTLRLHDRWKPLTIRYTRRGHYIYLWNSKYVKGKRYWFFAESLVSRYLEHSCGHYTDIYNLDVSNNDSKDYEYNN